MRLGLCVAIVATAAAGCGPRIVAKVTAPGGGATTCVGDRCAQLTPPGEGWEPLPSSVTDAKDGAAVGWHHPALDAVIMVHVTCKADRLQFEAAPLDALTRQLLLGTTERQTLTDETVPFSGREARHTTVLAKLDGVPRAYDVWVMRKNNCLLDLVYVAPPDRRSEGQAAFRRVVDSAAVESTLAKGSAP